MHASSTYAMALLPMRRSGLEVRRQGERLLDQLRDLRVRHAPPIDHPAIGAHHAVALALVPLRDRVLRAGPPEHLFMVADHGLPQVAPDAEALREPIDHELGQV